MIFQSVMQVMQLELNDMEMDDQNNPVFRGTAKLPKKAKGEAILLNKIYLACQKTQKEKQQGAIDDC